MYLIGIDFGHGETTASFIDTDNLNGGVQKLHILDGNTAEACKVESAICRDRTTGKWKFAMDFQDYCNPGLTLHFKAPMNEISSENKEAFGAFVKLVFENILKNQDFLHYNPVTGQKNFCIFAACPSGWTAEDSNQIQCYKDFLSSIIPVEWVIKESDAAYFKFKAEQNFSKSSVLVIDIGSSTIDFTAYGNQGLQSLSDGKKHGASHVEIEILKYFMQNSKDFKSAEKEARDFCRQSGVNWVEGIVHFVKREKEDFYTEQRESIYLDLRNKRFSEGLREFIFDSEKIERAKLENEILSNYKKALQNDLEEVKNRIGTPQLVILTGGASRMPWLQILVSDVFPEPESEIKRDSAPSYVVSDGIAHYAYAIFKLKELIKKVISDFWEKYDDATLAQKIFESFNESLRDVQLPKIKAICESFDKGELKYNAKDFETLDVAKPEYNGRVCTAAFVPAMIKHNEKIINDASGKISRDVNDSMNLLIKEDIETSLRNAFTEALHGLTPDIEITPSVKIALEGLQINSQWDVEKIVEMTRSIYEDLFNYGDIYKDRTTVEKRRKFSVPFYQAQEKANVTLPEDVMKEAVESLKSSIKSVLTMENLLSKCVFAIY